MRRWLGPLLLVLPLWALPLAPARADEADAARRQVLVLLQLPAPHYRPDGAYAGAYGNAVGRSARRAIAAELARSHGLKVVTDWPLPALGVDCWVLAVPPERTPAEVAETLAHDARVAWAQPMNLFRGQGHDDPLFAAQPAAAAWQLAELHEVATGRGITVAVVDSGIDAQHPDLAGRLAANENFVDERAPPAERHGTAVAGIIGARADDHLGIAGVAPGARLLGLRGCWQAAGGETLCTTLGLAKALHHALDSGAAVINLSLGGPTDRLLAQLIDTALARGVGVVAAFDPRLPDGGFPASQRGVLAVSDRPTPGALAAPGRDVPAPVPGARWDFVSGSSYAAAHVAGLLALLKEAGRGAGAARPALVPDAEGGVDACATLARVAATRAACATGLSAPRP